MIGKIAWKNIWFKPLNTMLSIILLTASVAIITVLVLLQKQFEEQFSSSMDNIDLVLGAKGSPLQLILSSVYQIDAPPGNISYEEAQKWMEHPFIATAIPLAYGDNYKGFRIIGTTKDYLEKFNAHIIEGDFYTNDFDVVIGHQVAEKLGLKVGDTFFGTHGDAAEGEVHEDHPYKIVGVASKTGQVLDNVILCSINSVWHMHDHEHDHNHGNDSAREDHQIHNHNHSHDHHQEHMHRQSETDHHIHHGEEHLQDSVSEFHGKEITAVLLKFRNKMGIVTWPRIIAQNTPLQAASPAIEINRLFAMFGVGLEALAYLAYGIMLISGISIFVALYNTLKERKYEFALLRVHGASRVQLLILVLFESVFLCVLGFILGTVFGRVALYLISVSTQEEFKMTFNPYEFVWEKEGIIFIITILVGIIAALIPAIKAYRLNISKTLANA